MKVSHVSLLAILFIIVIAGINANSNTSFSVLKYAMAITPPPVTQMNDTTSTIGLSTYSGRPLHAEYVSVNSTLVGKNIDTIKITLKQVKGPTGNATIGVFNSTLGVTKQFASVDVSKLPTSYLEQTYTLSNSSYTIKAGDYIGIKYSGGNSSSYIAIMTDQNAADPFDGSNTYYKYSMTTWHSFLTYDLTMKLIYHPPDPTSLKITAPAEILTWSTNSSKTIDLGTPVVTDKNSSAVTWWNSISGSGAINSTMVTLATGTYNVTWTAHDGLGNNAVAFQKVSLIKTSTLNPYNKQVMIQLDDGYQSQWDYAKPILDKYNINATFFIICGKPTLPPSPSGYMNWTLIHQLKNAGYEIEGHTMNHVVLDNLTTAGLATEISGAKACMQSQGFPVNYMADPYDSGAANQTVINAEINAGFQLVRGGFEPLQNLHCDTYKKHSSQTDCRTFFPNGTLTYANRYSLNGWNIIKAIGDLNFPTNNTNALQIFTSEINSPTLNNASSKLQIPIIYFHRVVPSNAAIPTSLQRGAETIFFDAAMHYLKDNGVKTLYTDQIAYNTTNNYLYLRAHANSTGNSTGGQPPLNKNCIFYNAIENRLSVFCNAHFAQLAALVNDTSKIAYQGSGVWLVNTTLVTANNTTFMIYPNDTVSWLKFVGPNGLQVQGMLHMENIKFTSWDPVANTVINENSTNTLPRAYIYFRASEPGWIKNSELTYLGFNSSGKAGVSIMQNSTGILLAHNLFHDDYYATYSNAASYSTFDGNEYYHNIIYAIDPHTDSHDFTIINNNIHDNHKFGIIFSLRTSNFLVQNNTIHDDGGGKNGFGYGIFFSRESFNNTARYNTVYNEATGIDVSQSFNNKVYDNKVSNAFYGIFIRSDFEGRAENNTIYDNKVTNSTWGVYSIDATRNKIGNTTFVGPAPAVYGLTSNSAYQIENQTFGNTQVYSDNTKNNLTIAKSGKILVSGYPTFQMVDTAGSSGFSTYSGRQIQAEYVTNSSVLVGKPIDTIMLKLKKVSSPTGNATIGIFNSTLAVKKTFGTINVSTLPVTYTTFKFSLSNSSQAYIIQPGDRIGIKFSGGNSTNNVGVMTDSTGSFDGTNSYYSSYTTLWNNITTQDLQMTLEIGSTAITPIYMQDTTVSAGLSTYSGRQINAEYVNSSSILVGNPIDTIKVQLKKVGSPTGNFTIGIFNPDRSVKKSFANVTAASLTKSYKDYTFSLPSSGVVYQIQSGDRIGIKYTGGDASNYVAIMTDRTNAFDGVNSYRSYYTNSWQANQTEDLYMTLKLNASVMNPTIYDTNTTPAIFNLSSINMTINRVG